MQNLYQQIAEKARNNRDAETMSKAATRLSQLSGYCQEELFNEAYSLAMEQNNLSCAFRIVDNWARCRDMEAGVS